MLPATQPRLNPNCANNCATSIANMMVFSSHIMSGMSYAVRTGFFLGPNSFLTGVKKIKKKKKVPYV